MKRIATISLLGILALVARQGVAHGGSSCNEWRAEHRELKARAAGLYLAGAPQARLDAALFDLLQREAYLTACQTSLQRDRPEMVGWRVVGRPTEQFAGAVLESILEQAGFDVALESLAARETPLAATGFEDAP
jgi:hypothetical protein